MCNFFIAGGSKLSRVFILPFFVRVRLFSDRIRPWCVLCGAEYFGSPALSLLRKVGTILVEWSGLHEGGGVEKGGKVLT